MSSLTVLRVPVERLSTTGFAPFGHVIAAGSTRDDPTLNRAPGNMAFLWVISELVTDGTPHIGVVSYRYRGSRVDYLQQHPGSTTVLVPIDGRPSVVTVAPDSGGAPDIDATRAFLLDGHRGIVVIPGVWIRYAYPLLEAADFAYVTARLDASHDIRRYALADAGRVMEWYFGPPTEPGTRLRSDGSVEGFDVVDLSDGPRS